MQKSAISMQMIREIGLVHLLGRSRSRELVSNRLPDALGLAHCQTNRRTAYLPSLPVERVDFLGAGVAKYKR
jgi:hypothetical protein